jgi:C1A family cysteine protease
LKAIRRFGVPPESAWRFDVARCDEDPAPPSLYCYAEDFRALTYLRLDPAASTGPERLGAVRSFLSAGVPVVFGFSVPDSISSDAVIPFRPRYDGLLGGQVVLAVGYDDHKLSSGARPTGESAAMTAGALLIRTSWGAAWGDEGYGWLPYSLVTGGYAGDFWVVLSPQWLASHEFTKPAVVEESRALDAVGLQTC